MAADTRVTVSLNPPRLCAALILIIALCAQRPAFAATVGYTMPGTNSYPTGMMHVVNRYTTPNPDIEIFVSALVDESKGFVYFGTGDLVTKLIKIRASDFSYVSELSFADDEYGIYSSVIDPAAGYAYCGIMMHGGATAPGAVVRIRLSDFTRSAQLVMESVNETMFACSVIDTTHGYAYFGTLNDSGKIVKVRLSDFTRVGALTLPAGENQLFCAAIDPAGGYAYFGTFTVPGKIIKIRLSDFKRVASMTLEADHTKVVAALIDPSNGYAYFGLDTSPGRIVKVRLADFKRVATMTLNSDENGLRGAAIDTTTGHAYFATNSSEGGGIVKIRLSDFKRAGTMKFNSTEKGLISGAIDMSRGNLFIGTSKAPVGAFKVNLSYKNSIHANRIENLYRAKITDVRFYAHGADRNIRLAIYDSSIQKRLLWQSNSTYISTANQWCVIPISKGTPSSLTLGPGGYWLAWQLNSNLPIPSGTFGLNLPSQTEFVIDQPYGSFPATIPDLKARRYTTTLWSEYMTFTALNTGADEWMLYR